jgi:hypothetical protein
MMETRDRKAIKVGKVPEHKEIKVGRVMLETKEYKAGKERKDIRGLSGIKERKDIKVG